MFWSNKKLTVVEKELEWGKLRYVQLGEYGRGRKPLNITMPDDISEIPAKEMLPYEIRLSKTMKPKLINYNGRSTFLAIDTLGAYIKNGEGKIQFLKEQQAKIKPIAFGWGAFGDAGRIGYAPAALLEVEPGVVIRYKLTRSDWEVVQIDGPGGVMYFDTTEIEPAIDVECLKLDGDWQAMHWESVSTLFTDK